jgi:hypothetical protein
MKRSHSNNFSINGVQNEGQLIKFILDISIQRRKIISECSLIRFQQIDIEIYGENSKEKNSFKIFGLTKEGISVICSIDDYFPYFYIHNNYPQNKDFISQLTSYLKVILKIYNRNVLKRMVLLIRLKA